MGQNMETERAGARMGELVKGVSRLDKRFTYLAHVPKRAPSAAPPGLLVGVHGSDYLHEETCRYFVELGNETNTVVLAPLFAPVDGAHPDPDGYKILRSSYADYDRVLLDMVADVVGQFGVAAGRFALFGFSGGAQFAHRFLYVYPRRLHAVSIAAPGMVTLIHPGENIWVGTRDLKSRFGEDIDLEQVRQVRTQLLVGSTDNAPHSGAAGEAAYNFAGRDRVERLESLAANYRSLEIPCDCEVVAGADHQFVPLAAAAVPFLRRAISSSKDET